MWGEKNPCKEIWEVNLEVEMTVFEIALNYLPWHDKYIYILCTKYLCCVGCLPGSVNQYSRWPVKRHIFIFNLKLKDNSSLKVDKLSQEMWTGNVV